LANAVTCAIPVLPGVHTTGTVNESQVPAQTLPLAPTVITLGLLDWNVKVSVMLVPPEFVADGVSPAVLPGSRLRVPGLRDTDAGTSLLVTFVVLPLLQEMRSAQPARTHTSDVAETNLPMNPSAMKLGAALLENSQFRGCRFFRQPVCTVFCPEQHTT
jgi:hypothetical protein